LIIVMGKLQPDRFSGGMQLTVTQVWDLEAARCRFGKYLRVTFAPMLGRAGLDVMRLLKDYPAQCEQTEQGDVVRGLSVRLALSCQTEAAAASAELQLGDRARFYPSNAALSSWWAQVAPGTAEIIYE
jgi:DNA polymerase-3 subunit alpha